MGWRPGLPPPFPRAPVRWRRRGIEHLTPSLQNSPKWSRLGQAMAAEQQRPWPYREVDIARELVRAA